MNVTDIELLETTIKDRETYNNLPLTNEVLEDLTLNIGLSSSSSASSTMGYIRSMLQHTIPDTRLFYPEPFLASPSYMHSDMHFLHILQYWYWV